MLNGPQHVKISFITTRHIPFWCTFNITGIYTIAHGICTILFRFFFQLMWSVYSCDPFIHIIQGQMIAPLPGSVFCLGWKQFSHPVVYLLMEFRWHPTSSLSHELHCGSFTMATYFIFIMFQNLIPGPRLNIKTVLSTYGDFHVKDKTAFRTSYL